MSTPRVRTRVLSRSSVGAKVTTMSNGYTATSSSGAVDTKTEYCSDWISRPPHPIQPLILYKRECKAVMANGTSSAVPVSGTSVEHAYTNFRFYRSQAVYSPPVPEPNWSALKNSALAGLNPTAQRPVDLVNFIIELREFPAMLRDLGKVLNKQLSPESLPGTYLGYEFGWKPLISDLMSLIDFSDQWNERLSALYRAGRSGRKRGKLVSRKDSTYLTPLYFTVQYGDGSNRATVARRLVTQSNAWYTCKLSPKVDFPSIERNFLEQFRKASLRGQAISTVWNSLPWTWLIDYFSGIGTFLEAHGGLLPYAIEDLCIMYQGDDYEYHEVSYRGRNSSDAYWNYTSDVEVSSGYLRTQSKQRAVFPHPTPSLWFDVALTKRQRRIIGALVLARLFGNRRAYS